MRAHREENEKKNIKYKLKIWWFINIPYIYIYDTVYKKWKETIGKTKNGKFVVNIWIILNFIYIKFNKKMKITRIFR